MEKLVDLGYTHKYSRFVISRADHVYGCEHALGGFELSKHVYIPRGEDYGGVCDRHIVCGASTVVRCLSMLQGALLHPERYSADLGPEAFFALRLRELGLSVRRFARVMFVARLEGETSSAHGVFDAVRTACHCPPRPISRRATLTSSWRRAGRAATATPASLARGNPSAAPVASAPPWHSRTRWAWAG